MNRGTAGCRRTSGQRRCCNWQSHWQAFPSPTACAIDWHRRGAGVVSGFALDTSTLSYYMRGEGGVAARLAATSPNMSPLPAVVVYEIHYGLLRAQRKAQLAAFERMVAVRRGAGGGRRGGQTRGDIRWALESASTPIGLHDVLIGATARRHQQCRHVAGCSPGRRGRGRHGASPSMRQRHGASDPPSRLLDNSVDAAASERSLHWCMVTQTAMPAHLRMPRAPGAPCA